MANEALTSLQTLLETDLPKPVPVRDALNDFAAAVKEGGPEVRQQMLELDAYNVIIKAWSLLCYSGVPTAKLFTPSVNEIRESSLKALYSLTAGFPEIIEPQGWLMLQQAIDIRLPESTQTFAMKVVRNICIKSEENREHITWELDLMEPLVLLIKRDKPSSEFVKEWCGAMKALILSDDVRVAYNRAPERKRMIHQQQTLPILTRHLHTYEGDEGTLNAIVVLLGSMAVNENMCIAIESGNVFPYILKIFKSFPQNKMLIKNTVSLLRYLNVSQSVREKCGGYGLVKWVLQLMLQQKNYEDVLEVGMSCLAFMTLRNACQTAQIMVAGGIPIIFELVQANFENIQILKGASLTVRNVAANGGQSARTKILDVNGEGILGEIQEKFPDMKENYIKPALRDLLVLEEEEEATPALVDQIQRKSFVNETTNSTT